MPHCCSKSLQQTHIAYSNATLLLPLLIRPGG